MLCLRDAKRADYPFLLDVVKRAFEEYRGVLHPPSSAHDETLASIERTMLTARAVIADVGPDAAGAVFYESYVDHIALFRLAVLPPFRGRGVGSALMNEVEARARGEGAPRIILTVRLGVDKNRSYYERRGYRFVREMRRSEDSTEMTHAILAKPIMPA